MHLCLENKCYKRFRGTPIGGGPGTSVIGGAGGSEGPRGGPRASGIRPTCGFDGGCPAETLGNPGKPWEIHQSQMSLGPSAGLGWGGGGGSGTPFQKEWRGGRNFVVSNLALGKLHLY